jgi:hypothetical protein
VSAKICVLCMKPGADAMTMKTRDPVHESCAKRFGIFTWVATKEEQ